MIFTFLYSACVMAVAVTGLYELMKAIGMLFKDESHE